MSFGSPWMLSCLIAVPAIVLAYVSMRSRRSRRTAELAEQGLVTMPTDSRVAARRRHVAFGLFAGALTVLTAALARPAMEIGVPRMEGTVILAFDVSNSMAADDVKPSRIDAARAAARAFVKRQPSTIRIGVVAFGDGALITQAPTHAQDDVLGAIDRLSVEGGTSLGQGLFASLSAIAGKPLSLDESALASDTGEVDIGYFGSSAVVLLSDGENTIRPDPIAIAEIASVAGVHVDTIGVGTEDGTVLKIDDFNVATALDRELLEQVASVTDGTYYEAADASALSKIYGNIDLELTAPRELIEVTAAFAGAGALLLLVGALLSTLWFGRVV